MTLQNKRNEKLNKSKIQVNKNIKDHSDDPFFLEKAERSKKTVAKYGLPGQPLRNK